jgi:hypothetical protein
MVFLDFQGIAFGNTPCDDSLVSIEPRTALAGAVFYLPQVYSEPVDFIPTAYRLYHFLMATLQQLDVRLSMLNWRLDGLRRQRDNLLAESSKKRFGLKAKEFLRLRIEAIDIQIKAAEEEEWEADDERYDLLWCRH